MSGLLTQELLRQLLDYDPVTGLFRWKPRSKERFSAASSWLMWNKRYAGTLAGGVSKKGYVLIRVEHTRYPAHRLAWLYVHGAWPVDQIDHINLSKKDNRIANLRECTMSQNKANSALSSNNTSGFKGVAWCKNLKKWRAYLRFSGKRISLGYYHTPSDAHAAYCKAATEYFGEFARHG